VFQATTNIYALLVGDNMNRNNLNLLAGSDNTELVDNYSQVYDGLATLFSGNQMHVFIKFKATD